jgi:nucleotide-binding universal stress UspA family protein
MTMTAITLKRILVPTDFSDPSDVALRYGVKLADAFGARLHLLHVVELLVEQRWAAELAMVAAVDVEAESRARSDAALAQLLTRDERERYSATLVSVTGAPFLEIVRYARREDIDLIVMGTHGRSAIAHLLVGSVAENVVRKAPCPVLTVPVAGHDFVKP